MKFTCLYKYIFGLINALACLLVEYVENLDLAIIYIGYILEFDMILGHCNNKKDGKYTCNEKTRARLDSCILTYMR